ncbi:MAG: hypothetical protein IJ191_02085 [Treponema sp.]|nr:hypothetical protein [Treponema sp.]
MKKLVLSIGAALCIYGMVVFPVSGQSLDTSALNDKMGSALDTISNAVTEATSQMNLTAEAYIGKLFPSLPAHFMVGLSASTTIIDMNPLKDAIVTGGVDSASVSGVPHTLVLPAWAIQARLGGIVLPFDIGGFVSFSIPISGLSIDLSKMSDAQIKMIIKNTSAGLDLRYAILQGKGRWPKISLGGGYFYVNKNYTFAIADGDNSLDTTFTIKTHALYVQMQISKQFAFIAPYLGARALFTKEANSFSWDAHIESSTPKDYADTASFGHNFEASRVQPQIFAGIGFLPPFGQITLGCQYNPRLNLWTVSVHGGFRM